VDPAIGEGERCSGYALFLRKPFNIFDVVVQIENLIRKNRA
jgi:hypothetical protein